MPKLIKDGAIASDEWQLLSADEAASELPQGKIILPLTVWQERQAELSSRQSEIGVWLDSADLADTLGESAKGLPLVAINFPTFMDGRGFSTARLLRDSYGFDGELRAIGHIIRDQLFYLKRCGFNSFTFADDIDVEAALASLQDFSEAYQTCVERKQPLFRRRA